MSLTKDVVDIVSLKSNTIANVAPLFHTHTVNDITGLANVAKSGSATDLILGTLPKARLPLSPVTPGSYGTSTGVPVITVDANGIITNISTTPVSGGGSGTGGGTGTINLSGTAVPNNIAVFADSNGNIKDGGTLANIAKSGSATDIITGRLTGDRLPFPTPTGLGGVQANAGTAGQVVTGIDPTTGALTYTTPTIPDKSLTFTKFADANGPAILGRTSATTGALSLATVSNYLDTIVNNTGAVLVRGANGWVSSGIGTAGQVLMSTPGFAPVFADNVPSAVDTNQLVNGAATNAKQGPMPSLTVKANLTTSSAAPQDVNAVALKTMLALNNVNNTSDAVKAQAGNPIGDAIAAISSGTNSSTNGTVAIPTAANQTPSSTTAGGATYPRPRLAKTIPRDAPLSPFWWIDPIREWGIRNGTDRVNCRNEIQAGLDAGEDIDIGVGRYMINDALILKRQTQMLTGRNRYSPAGNPPGMSGSTFETTQDFNMGAQGIIIATHETRLEHFNVSYWQPANVTSASQLKQYPWVWNILNAQRSKLRYLRCDKAWNGLWSDCVGAQSVGGSNTIENMEIGTFNCAYHSSQHAGDFMEWDNIRCWVFDFADRPDLLRVHYAECDPYGYIGEQDGGTIGNITHWKTRFVYANPSHLTVNIANLNLDGGKSRLDMQAGNLQIANLNALSDAAESCVHVTGPQARLQVGNAFLESVISVPDPHALLKINDGACQIANLRTHSFGQTNTRHILSQGGRLQIGNHYPTGIMNVDHTAPIVEKQSPGRMSISNLHPEDKGTGSGSIYVNGTDEWEIVNASSIGWNFSAPNTQNFGQYHIR